MSDDTPEGAIQKVLVVSDEDRHPDTRLARLISTVRQLAERYGVPEGEIHIRFANGGRFDLVLEKYMPVRYPEAEDAEKE